MKKRILLFIVAVLFSTTLAVVDYFLVGVETPIIFVEWILYVIMIFVACELARKFPSVVEKFLFPPQKKK